jgi:hypothetical protein
VCRDFLVFSRYAEVAREFLNLIHYIAISNLFVGVLANVRLENINAWISAVSETYLGVVVSNPTGGMDVGFL